MNITKVNDYIYQYQFLEGEGNSLEALNITVIVDDKSALIIDTAYSKFAKKVKDDLANKEITPEIVVISHYHPDHIDGTKEFKGCQFIGSKFYKYNLENCEMWFPDSQYIKPNVLIEDDETIEFANHKLKFIHTPGHSKCSITIIINDEIMYVGDLAMKNEDGKVTIPYVCQDGTFEEHIDSLQRILNLDCNIMLVGHGDYIEGKDEIKNTIEDRMYYLEKVKESKGKLRLEDCLKYDISKYCFLDLHDRNIQHF